VSRPAKPAHLFLRDVRGNKLWYIRDNGCKKSTGCSAHDRADAEAKLAAHIATRIKPSRDSGRDPSTITIAELLNIYSQDRGAKVARPEALCQRIDKLLDFFGDKLVTAINKRLCRDYVEHRGSEQAARRELEDLRAALGHAFDEEILTGDIRRRVELPAKAPPRERWLTRSEAARLLWAAWRFRSSEEIPRATRQHLARFALVALYTGTRSAAVCGAAMSAAIGRGYVDLDRGMLYRRAPGTPETNKRQRPVRLPDRLLAHIRRWKRRGISLRAVVEFNDEPIVKVNKGFACCVAAAGLEIKGPRKVTPHTLRHTAISWSMQNGTTIWEASEFFGVSPEVLTSVYAHHSPDRMKAVAEAITRKPNGR
jgi:integrase